MRKNIFLSALTAILFMACNNKNSVENNAIKIPVIESVSRNFVQAGDTISIYGTNLVQEGATTELSISGRPVKMLESESNKIKAIVNQHTYSGKLMITVSSNENFVNAYGPQLTVNGSPKIISFSPGYAYAGEVVTFKVENFSSKNEDNLIELGGKKMEIVYNNNKDSIQAKVPSDPASTQFTYSTYGGPAFTFSGPFSVRKPHYEASTIMEWLLQDPAFKLTYFGLNLASVQSNAVYDTLAPFLKGLEPAAIFISINSGYATEMGIHSEEEMRTKMNSRSYELGNRILASVVPGFAPPKQLEEGIINTRNNEQIIIPHENRPDRRPCRVLITKDGNDYYIQSIDLNGWNIGTRKKIRFVAQIGNTYLYEIPEPLGYDSVF